MNALGKSLEQNINIQRIKTEGMPDVTPTTIKESIEAAVEGVNTLVRSFLKEEGRSTNSALAFCLQKGVDLEHSLLTCSIAVRKTDTREVSTITISVPISSKVKRLMEQDRITLYEAYRVVYGDDVADKKVLLYEKIYPGSKEVDWPAEGISLALKQYM